MLTNPLLLLLLLTTDVIRLTNVERGNKGGYGSVWGGVHLVMGVIIFWTPIESRLVHTFRNIFVVEMAGCRKSDCF